MKEEKNRRIVRFVLCHTTGKIIPKTPHTIQPSTKDNVDNLIAVVKKLKVQQAQQEQQENEEYVQQ